MTAGDDHALAARLAHITGQRLVELLEGRAEPRNGANAAAALGLGSLEYAGDRLAHEVLCEELGKHRPDDAVLSEEGHDDGSRLSDRRVWIVDPLDGSRDFGWSGAWAVHVGLCEDGAPIAGAVAVPAWGETFGSHPPARPTMCRVGRCRVVVSRSQRNVDGARLAAALDAEVVAMGSVGVKAMAVVRGEVDVYAHTGGFYEWDACAPAAVAAAAGLHVSAPDGSPLRFNNPDPWQQGLVICRPELAQRVLEALAVPARRAHRRRWGVAQ